MRQPSILVVDDEANIRRVLRITLSSNGFHVAEVRSGEEALDIIAKVRFDLALLDINMRGLSGVETCRRIRTKGSKMGIVMLTVRDSQDDKIRALGAGADDYVTKPFIVGELIARIQAVLRRISFEKNQDAVVLQIGDLRMDCEHRIVVLAGDEIHLTPTEFELLALLMKNAGVPMTHACLLQTIWGVEYGSELEYLRSYVRMLRKKIEANPAEPGYILTEPWIGYRFRSPDTASAAG